MLVRTTSEVLNYIHLTLVFDDMSEKSAILKVNDRHKITYIEREKLVTVEGVITKILPSVSDTVIYMDCSDQFRSNEVKLSVNMIRDIHIDLDNQHGITYTIDDMILEKNYIITNIQYDNTIIGSKVNLFFDINSKIIDPEIFEGLLKQQFDINLDVGSLYSTFTIDLGDKKYKTASKYSFNSGWNIPALTVGHDIRSIQDHKIINRPFALNIFYRSNINDPWRSGVDLPIGENILDLGDQLVLTLGIERNKLFREYGDLIRFEPIQSDNLLNYRFDFYDDNMNMLGTEYLALTYDNKFKPTGIKFNNEIIELKVGQELQLVGKVYPEKISIPGIAFTSNNLEIVTVDDIGKLTAISIGETTITAYPIDNKEVIKTFEIKVIKADDPPPVEPEPEPDPPVEPEPEKPLEPEV